MNNSIIVSFVLLCTINIKLFLSVGGANIRNLSINVMKKALTDELAQSFSFTGKKGYKDEKKMAFVTTQMVMPLFYDVKDSSSAFRDSRSSHISYFKGLDGNCYRQEITNVNGHEVIKNDKVDCAEAEREMKKHQAKTEHQIKESFKKVTEDIRKTQKTIEDQFKNTLKGFNFF